VSGLLYSYEAVCYEFEELEAARESNSVVKAMFVIEVLGVF